MKQIWSVVHEKSGRHWWFDDYDICIQSVIKTFGDPRGYGFPKKSQTTPTTRIGYSPDKGDWIQIDSVMVQTEVVNLFEK